MVVVKSSLCCAHRLSELGVVRGMKSCSKSSYRARVYNDRLALTSQPNVDDDIFVDCRCLAD